MKKIITFALLTLAASAALAGPYECQKLCSEQIDQCITDCTNRYDGYQWDQCMVACKQQKLHCNDRCTQ